MWISRAVFCLSLILCGLLGECFGIALVPKDKRGWTLNSAGYLLGPPLLPFQSPVPKADAQQTMSDKGGLAGKRDTVEELYPRGEESFGHSVHSRDNSNLQSLMDFLSYLNLQDQRAVSRLRLPLMDEPIQQ
ncbi:galanin peptides isoform X1 [Anolis carolinensis]|uniref:Galanin domain-containing protein n=1 Tax=Anolis carolinensis TaxID=28377 RepID=R4GC36_ANOCA|nr:PREDICTED: galanin peptides isoform X1 [Anolis carolinensis]|eukprot:XP_008117109.1 PREDICTED: galanin peptides isoform X1 [Anolis carolinensis]